MLTPARLIFFGLGISMLSAGITGHFVRSAESNIQAHIARQSSATYQHITEFCK